MSQEHQDAELNRLTRLLSDDKLNELMFNGHRTAFAERNGALEQIASPFRGEADLQRTVEALARLKGSVGADLLQFDGMLPDGSRFHVTRPPLSPDGPTLTIRKFAPAHRGLENLVASGMLTIKAARFLDACVRARMNILISGGTGAGKTTLLNALCSRVETTERIITVEDIAEVQLSHPNWVRLVAVHREGEGSGVSVRDCLVGSLRMRPDRIVIGECRSREALDMLQALNTGHDGGMTTIHANSTGDALTRLESLILFHAGAEIPIKSLRRQIVDALDMVIQVRKSADGRRAVEEILEVVSMEADVITRLPLFKHAGPKGQIRLMSTGHVPHFLKRFEERGVALPKNFFDPQAFESP